MFNFFVFFIGLQRAGDVGGQFERWTAAVSGGPQHSGGPQAGCSMLTYVLYFLAVGRILEPEHSLWPGSSFCFSLEPVPVLKIKIVPTLIYAYTVIHVLASYLRHVLNSSKNKK